MATNAVSLNLTEFWEQHADAWFAQAEAQFNLIDISAQDTMYCYVVPPLTNCSKSGECTGKSTNTHQIQHVERTVYILSVRIRTGSTTLWAVWPQECRPGLSEVYAHGAGEFSFVFVWTTSS